MLYNITSLLLKTLASLCVTLVAIISLLKVWKFFDRRTSANEIINKFLIKGWIFYGLLSIAIIWIDPFLQSRAENDIKNDLKPEVEIELYENSKSQIGFSVRHINESTKIDDLSFKFDIPGTFINSEIKNIDKIENYRITSVFRSGIGSPRETIVEKVHIWCSNVLPKGFLRGEINFSPTLPRPIPGSEGTPYEESYMPVMDLHDFSTYVYTWVFKGNVQEESKCMDLRGLECVKKDNENLLFNFQQLRMEKAIRKFNPSFKSEFREIYTKEWLEKMEEERRDW
jgi:hypothetical protein